MSSKQMETCLIFSLSRVKKKLRTSEFTYIIEEEIFLKITGIRTMQARRRRWAETSALFSILFNQPWPQSWAVNKSPWLLVHSCVHLRKAYPRALKKIEWWNCPLLPGLFLRSWLHFFVHFFSVVFSCYPKFFLKNRLDSWALNL